MDFFGLRLILTCKYRASDMMEAIKMRLQGILNHKRVRRFGEDTEGTRKSSFSGSEQE
jgi:hypothetical protein